MAGGTRRAYIDWARGLAVLIMIGAHVLDSWTRPSERDTLAFGYLNLLGGFAAPLFLWLAGLALVLAAERARTRTSGPAGAPDRAGASSLVIRRGLEIFLLAFLFRLQAFIVSPGNPLVSLLRVDILNIMGPSMMGAGLLWRVASGPRSAAILCGAAAAAIAMVTPIVRTAWWLGSLPPFVQWYISPSGNHSTFTLFPWSGFVFAGAACGAMLAMTRDGVPGRLTVPVTDPAPEPSGGSEAIRQSALEDNRRESQAMMRIALAGALLIAAGYYLSLLPSIYSTSAFWTTSPTYFILRVGVLMVLLGGLFAVAPLAVHLPRPFRALAHFGRHSLFVYWIHVELVYGYATALWHHRLPLWGTAAGYMAFACAMYWSIDLRDRLAQSWRARRPHRTAQQTLGA
jgi:uncharacterized membrane protein